MIRKTLTIVSLIGLLLSTGLWGLSYWNVSWQSFSDNLFVRNGTLGYEYVWRTRADLIWGGFNGLRTDIMPKFDSWTVPTVRGEARMWSIQIPFWILVLSFGILFCFLDSPSRLSRRRRKLGLCLKCGYDLRGSKERCPECGTGFSN